MNTLTLVGALYVCIPAVMAMVAVLYATYCPVVVVEEGSSVRQAVYGQLVQLQESRAAQASQSIVYWQRMANLAVTHEARARAKMYAKMFRAKWEEHYERAERYRTMV